MPNENTTWVNALLCGPDMPTVALLDFENTGAIDLALEATEPLQTYTVTVRGAHRRTTIRPRSYMVSRAGRSRPRWS